jgi:glycosyltransferase involved in cell wall biosynthesis
MPDGECGSLVPPEDPQAMAAAIAALVADPERAREQARRGAARIRARFDRDAGLRSLWDEIVTVRTKAPSQVPTAYARSFHDPSAPFDR